MNAPGRQYVLNLPDWELPRLDDMEWDLVDQLAEAARRGVFRPESLKDGLHEVIHESLMTLAESAVNEVLEYWLKGLGDGNNGKWPELAVELPYLGRGETTEPLALTYCVTNSDGTRTELNRTTLDAVISRILQESDRPQRIRGRAKLMVFALRKAAERLETFAGV